ncbi:nuclear transport factor 2 family protein [Streptomyces sp. NPDC054855]
MNANVTYQDQQDIADLMTGWIHRDLGEWDRLKGLFHPDGRIEITWFEGRAYEFVDASARMGESAFRTKHLITAPVVTFSPDGTRAVSETNAVIIGENVDLRLGCNGQNRFIDRLEKRDGVWRISDRKSVYDFGSFTYPVGIGRRRRRGGRPVPAGVRGPRPTCWRPADSRCAASSPPRAATWSATSSSPLSHGCAKRPASDRNNSGGVLGSNETDHD